VFASVLPAPLVPVLAAIDQDELDACGIDPSSACRYVFRQTDSEVLARAADWLIARPLHILLIVGIALLVNYIAQRAISRFVAGLGRARARTATIGMLATPEVAAERARMRAHNVGLALSAVTKVAIFVIAGLMVLSELSLNLGPLLAGAGIVGVAFGFGAQTFVRDFLAGMFMLIEDQFGVGDVIDVGDASGVVEGVSFRTTTLRDDNGVVWYFPNGEIKRVANKSQGGTAPT
jgi:moderate conductance mechanosensitive channel